MGDWLANHGLELALALVSGAWFVSKMLVNFGEWRAAHTPAALTEERLQRELRDLTHAARDLIIKDLSAMVQRIEKKVDDASAKSSEQWSRVQGKMADLELKIVVLETRQERE